MCRHFVADVIKYIYRRLSTGDLKKLNKTRNQNMEFVSQMWFHMFLQNHFVVNRLSHWGQEMVFWPVWVFSWIEGFASCKKTLLQKRQKCDFSLEWRLFSCTRTLDLELDIKLQVWHLNGLSSKWTTFICFAKDHVLCGHTVGKGFWYHHVWILCVF